MLLVDIGTKVCEQRAHAAVSSQKLNPQPLSCNSEARSLNCNTFNTLTAGHIFIRAPATALEQRQLLPAAAAVQRSGISVVTTGLPLYTARI